MILEKLNKPGLVMEKYIFVLLYQNIHSLC